MEGREVTLGLLGTNELEVAYIAGLFDGEGSIFISRDSRSYNNPGSLVVSLGMTAREPLDLLSRIFGGRTKTHKRYPPHNTLYDWRLGSKKAEVFLRIVKPYLIVKKEEANLALSFQACGRKKSSRKAKLSELISPRRTNNHDVNPDEQNDNST
ncbi:hypothetical protein ES703_71985 [subsurface metagenome]